MLKNIVDIVYVNGYEILSIDSVIIAEEPKLSPYIEEMKKNISSTGIPIKSINIKSKTNEGMGFIGKGEGISAFRRMPNNEKHRKKLVIKILEKNYGNIKLYTNAYI
jgi:2-C-methyl-D-erythritol 2,4-cyclodiphosphate synthase